MPRLRAARHRPRPGRPVHVEHGLVPGCARLNRHQAADDERRREQFPGLILDSEPVAGPVQRHWLHERISRREAEQIAAGLAAGHWPHEAARLPWVTSAYPES